MKYLRVTMPDGSRWDVPAHLIATSRAKYYAKNKFPKLFEHEFDSTMGSLDRLLDWAENDMNWSQVKAYATKVEGAQPVDYEDGWTNGEKELVEHD
jgi:hypothetical protein